MNKEKKSFKDTLRRITASKLFPLILLYIIMCVIFTVWAKLVGANFLKFSTFRNILESLVITSFLTIGAGCLLIAGHIDLSQAAVGALGSMVLGWILTRSLLPLWLTIIIALAICALLGAANAFMVTKLRFPSFIATLAMASMARGIMYLFSAIGNENGTATNQNFKNEILKFIGKGSLISFQVGGEIWSIPVSILIMIVFFVIYGILMSKTRFGAKVMLLGGNPVAANLAGINATAIMFILFINSAVLGGVGGIFNAAKLQQGAIQALTANQFTGITAAILGGISFGGGAGNMFGAFVGLLILNTFQIGMNVVGVNPYWINVFSGILLLIALAFDFISRRSSSKAAL